MHLKKFAHFNSKYIKIEKPWLAVKPYHDKSASPCYCNSRKDHCRGRDQPELKIKNYENYKKGQGEYNLESIFRTYLAFIIAGKSVGNTWGQGELAAFNLFMQVVSAIFYDIDLGIPWFFIKNDVTNQKSILTLYDLGAADIIALISSVTA